MATPAPATLASLQAALVAQQAATAALQSRLAVEQALTTSLTASLTALGHSVAADQVGTLSRLAKDETAEATLQKQVGSDEGSMLTVR